MSTGVSHRLPPPQLIDKERTLDLINPERTPGHLVEPVSIFEDERLPVRLGSAEDGSDEGHDGDKDEALLDLARAPEVGES